MADEKSSNIIITSNSLTPSVANVPLDNRTRVQTEDDIINIQLPYIGMIVYVIDSDSYFKITQLKDKEVGMLTVKNGAVADYIKVCIEQTYPVLYKELELMNYYNIDTSLLKENEPYCSVDRYGGDNTGTRCSSDSIQIAIDIAEYLCKNDFLNNPITFNSGVYKMTKTVLIKKSMEETSKDTPIVIKGSCSRIHTHSSTGHTALRIEIPNHLNKDYANAFAINVSYSDAINRNDETDDFVYKEASITDIGFELFPIINHIEFRDLAFYVDRSKFTVNIIKGYRYRSKIENIEVNGANRLIYQPLTNINNKGSYCDFSHYSNLNFNNMKKNGLELSTPDNSIIEEITCHRLGKDATELIRVVNGGGFKISRVHYAYSFEEDTTTPRNDGKGRDGNSSIILLNGCNSVKIENMYIERCLKDYVIRLYNTNNIEISNTNEMFFSNGFIKIEEKCDGINIHDIYRNCNLVTDYNDIFIKYGAKYSNLRIHNFLCKNFYDNQISLEFNDFNTLKQLDKNLNNYREVIHNMDLIRDDIIQCDELTLNISYYNGALYVKNAKHQDIDYTISFNNGALALNDYIVSISPSISSDSEIIPHMCCIDSSNRKQIIFIDKINNTKISELDNSVRCDVKIRTLNKYMFIK